MRWAFETRSNPHLNGRSLLWSMGKVLGGSSSIYVYPDMDRPNLTVLTNAVVTRIKAKGARATGVEVVHEGLRTADGSIVPRVTTGNTMAPCIIIGERAASMIREDYGL
jgi:choline dehydrogenase-like flavoprotein